MNIYFACPECDRPGRLARPGPTEWQCPACDHLLRLRTEADEPLNACPICGNEELYKKKDFPHWLGMGILAVACVSFLVLNAVRHQWWAWGVLLGSAVFDGLLYLWVPDVVVCYRCGAHYRGFSANPAHQPYELSIGERYRQEKIRREHLKEKPNV